MPEVIGILDGGTTTIGINGKPSNVGVIIFRTSENESAPVDHIGFCKLVYKDAIIKNLKRIVWAKPKQKETVTVNTDGVEQ